MSVHLIPDVAASQKCHMNVGPYSQRLENYGYFKLTMILTGRRTPHIFAS